MRQTPELKMQRKKSKNKSLGSSSKKKNKGIDAKILKIYGINNNIHGRSINKAEPKYQNQSKYLIHTR